MLPSFLCPSTLVLHPDYAPLAPFMHALPSLFAQQAGQVIHQGRNELRLLTFEGQQYVVKSFRRPIFINRIVYGLLRPSKAKRSYHNALLLKKLGIGTPTPVGYINIRRGLLFDQSYFVTCCSPCTHRYEELFATTFVAQDAILQAIAHTTARLHQHGLAHKDYGRANILFEETPEGIQIELVDLNRMYHGTMTLARSCQNFERLPATPHMHQILAEAYAQARGWDAAEVLRLMKAYRSTQPGKIDGKY